MTVVSAARSAVGGGDFHFHGHRRRRRPSSSSSTSTGLPSGGFLVEVVERPDRRQRKVEGDMKRLHVDQPKATWKLNAASGNTGQHYLYHRPTLEQTIEWCSQRYYGVDSEEGDHNNRSSLIIEAVTSVKEVSIIIDQLLASVAKITAFLQLVYRVDP